MNKEVRTIIVDGTEIMTSLTAVEIADRLRTYDDLKEENKELNRMCELYSKSLYNAELTDYKSRCEKANTYINEEIKKIQEHQYSTGVRRLKKIQNILNRSDENEH